MKKFSSVMLIVTLVLLVSLLSGCGQSVSVSIEKLPDRSVYYVGEVFDVTGGLLKVSEDGNEKIVEMEEEFVVYYYDDTDKKSEQYENLMLAGEPFDSEGEKVVALKYKNIVVTLNVYVNDDIDAYRAYCGAMLDELAASSDLDSAVLSVVTDAKRKMSETKKPEEVSEIYSRTKNFILEYYSVKDDEKSRDKEEEKVIKNIEKLNKDDFAYDQQIELDVIIEKLLSDVSDAKTASEIKKLYSTFQKEVKALENHHANDFIEEMEERFDEEYASRHMYYTEKDYQMLVSALVEHEKLIRTKEKEFDMIAIRDSLFNDVLPSVTDVVKTVAAKCDVLVEKGLVYSVDRPSLVMINADVISFIEETDGVDIKDANLDGAVDVRDIIASDEYKNLSASISFSQHEDGDVLALVSALLDRYDELEAANKASEYVMSAIEDIGKVNLGSGAKIASARKAYDDWCEEYSISLSDKNRNLVDNYSDLTDAEEIFEDMPAEAARDAKSVRELITALDSITIIYSNTSSGTGRKVENAQKAYEDWVDEYGDYASDYINETGKDYISQLNTYIKKYNDLVTEAEAIKKDMQSLYALVSAMKYDSYSADYAKVEAAKKALATRYDNFKKSNGNVADVITDYDKLEAKVAKGRYDVFSKHYSGELEFLATGYIAIMSNETALVFHKTSMRALLRTSLSDIEKLYDEELSFERNLDELEKLYESCKQEIEDANNEYKFELAIHTAEMEIDLLAEQYEDKIDNIDELVYDAISELNEIENKTGYENKIKSVVDYFKAKLK